MRRLFLTAGVMLLSACGPQLPQGGDSDPRPAAQTAADPTNFLSADEIAQTSASTLYDVIQKLRPNFLVSRGSVTIKTTASPYPVVFRDGSYFGDMSSLRNIQPSAVESVRMYRAWESTTKFGSSYTAGVISVTSRKL